jgi:hypothetical protein
MRNPRAVRLRKPSRVALMLAESDVDEIIECIANAADRAESTSYDLASTPRAQAIAKERAKHLYNRKHPGKAA